jgi:hypothetical protein
LELSKKEFFLKNIEISKNKLSSKITIKIDNIIEKLSKEKLKKVYTKIEKIGNKIPKKYKYLIMYIKAKIGLKIFN